jgi:hypothetical protein
MYGTPILINPLAPAIWQTLKSAFAPVSGMDLSISME